MFVVITDPSGWTPAPLYQRRLGPNELLEPIDYGRRYAESIDCRIDESPGHVPSCSGDIRVEIKRKLTDDVCIWSGESFYFAQQESAHV